jgi:hypothetical protein
MFAPPIKNIKDWLRKYSVINESIAYLVRGSADVQNNNVVFVTLKPSESVLKASNANKISQDNLIENAVFVSVRKVIEQTWINDRDQYLYPNSKWEDDDEFKSDCIAFMLFDQSNTVKSSDGTNHWIPFTEQEVNARSGFDSHFMTDFIKGKIRPEAGKDLFQTEESKKTKAQPLVFSPEAQDVFEAGKALWAYYHTAIYNLPILGGQKWTVNASFYDIKEYFQARNEKGKMNNRSEDDTYNALIATLREKLKALAKKIEPKVYEYGFLKS